MFRIRFARGALGDLRRLRAFDRTRVLEHIERLLSDRPAEEGTRKKVLTGLVVPWERVRPIWQLRVGDHRVFYDVDEDARQVVVQAVRRKPPGKTTEEIL